MKKLLVLMAIGMIMASMTGCCCCRRVRDWLYQGAYCGPTAAPVAAPTYAPPITYAAPQPTMAVPQAAPAPTYIPQAVPMVQAPIASDCQPCQPCYQTPTYCCEPACPPCYCQPCCPPCGCDPCYSGYGGYGGYGDCGCGGDPCCSGTAPGVLYGGDDAIPAYDGATTYSPSPSPTPATTDPGPASE